MQPQDFKYDNFYDIRTGFSRVKYGSNRGLLETELNEMQKIQEQSRASLVRKIVPSGFVELKRSDILDDSIICHPNNTPYSIAFAPSKAFISGYEISVEGNLTVNGKDGYLKVNLPNSPATFFRNDFVFLEMWFEELDENSAIRKYGYVDGDLMTNTLVDERVNEETSRRIGLRWRIRVEEDLNFNRWKDGFGFLNETDFSPIYALGGKGQRVENIDYVFRSAKDDIFKNCDFYGDNGLYVAGRPENKTANSDLKIVENYVYAIPLASVRRRNINPYSVSNPNGASLWTSIGSGSTHPAGLFYNKMERDDIIDRRRSISFSGWDANTMLQRSLKDLVVGNLQTNKNESAHRIQFGVPALTMSSDPDISFISKFNSGANNESGIAPSAILGNQTLKYGFGAIADGLVINGESAVEYNLSAFNKLKGTIDFFLRPYWSSADTSVTQNIFSFIDPVNSIKAFEFKKSGNNLILTLRLDSSGNIASTVDLLIDLSKNIVKADKIHHFRITWDYVNRVFALYMDGRQISANTYNSTSLNPTKIRIGEVQAIDNNLVFSKSIIDEIVMYKEVKSTFPQLTNDFIQGESTIYPSFNSYLSGYADNSYEQNNFVKDLTPTNGTSSATLSAPFGVLISTSTPIVYNNAGVIIAGTWSGLGTASAVFTLSSGTFNGSSIYVKHNLLVPAGHGPFELPTAVLKGDLNGKEASFNRKNAEIRQISLSSPRTTLGQTDRAYDYNTTRTTDQCFARLLHYYVSGNGQDKYYLPPTLYGYDVIGIRYVSRKYDSIIKIDGDITKKFEIELNQAMTGSQFVEIQVLLGGLTFDYEIHNKGVVSNTLKTTNLSVVAPGNTETFVFKLDVQNGYNTIVSSVANFKGTYNAGGVETGTTKKHIAYINGLETEIATVTGFGTPFLTVVFESTPLIGETIEIPILATYSPKSNDILSVWIKHVPYQGVMNSENHRLKRVSNWVHFVTTLSSGKIISNTNIPIRSIHNALNRLPGGGSRTQTLQSQEIKFANDTDISLYGGMTRNKKFVITNEATNVISGDNLDLYFNELDNNLLVKKGQADFQDGKLDAPYNLYGFCLEDTTAAINKYAGSACLVVNEGGEIMMFLFGNIHEYKSTTDTISKPTYGDLFILQDKPTMLSRKNTF